MSLFLEISSIGSACGKNFFEPTERTMLCNWARKDKHSVIKFLIDSKCLIVSNTESDEEQFEIEQELATIYSEQSSNVKNASEFKHIEGNVIRELKKRKVVSEEQVDKARETINDNLKKDAGKNSEVDVIKTNNYKRGNSKMYYYSVGGNKIGGLHDAIDNEMVIEIKTRTSPRTIRKNEYDLYQLFGYLLAMNLTKGKIVQKYADRIFSSDVETDKEYGIIDITQEPWKSKLDIMRTELVEYFAELENVIKTKKISLDKGIPSSDRPIATLMDDRSFCNIHPKFNRLLRFLS
jgi:hypothetical protein